MARSSSTPIFRTTRFLRSFASTENVKYVDDALVPADTGKPASVVLKLASPYIISGVSQRRRRWRGQD